MKALSVSPWPGFAAMCIGMFMAILDIQVVVTSLPVIEDALKIGADRMSWVQTAYLIAEIIAIPLTGLLTRILSMRWLFVTAVTIFTLASISCAVSPGFASLIAARVVQGFAGGVLIPLVFSAVFLLFPAGRQTLATAIAGLLAVLAPTLGPWAGGWITENWSWHWLFLINVGPGIAAAVAGGFQLPRENSSLSHARHLDWISLALIALSLAALEIGLNDAPDRGWMSSWVLALLALSLASAAAFVRRVSKSPEPVVAISLFAGRSFAAGCAASFILGFGLYGMVYLIPVFLAFVGGLGPLAIGKIMLVTGIAQLAGAPAAAALDSRIDARILAAAGFAAFAAGLAMSAGQTRDTGFDEMFWPQVVRGLAIMFCILPPARMALGALSPEQVADGSSLFNLMRNLGGAIGLALIDTIIYGRAPIHADTFMEQLRADDPATLKMFGLTPEDVAGGLDPMLLMSLMSDIEQASLVPAVNEAWTMLAAVTACGLICVLFARKPESVGARRTLRAINSQ